MSSVAERTSLDWLNRRSYPYEPHHLLVDGGRMHFVDEGRGEPMLFLHGCPTWSYLFRTAIRQFSGEGFRCVAPDHIGFGLSEKPRAWSYSAAAHARNIVKLIDHLGLEDITLVMHEMGGPIGLNYAIENPGKVKRIVLMNSFMADTHKEPNAQKLAKAASGPLGKFLHLNTCSGPKSIRAAFANKERYTEEINNAYMGPFANKEDRISTLESAKQLVDGGSWFNEIWDNRQALSAKPMLLIWGLKDPTFGEKTLNRIWHEFPLADVATFPECGPYTMEEKPRETLSALKTFMNAPVKSTGFLA